MRIVNADILAQADRQAAIFKILSHPRRVLILRTLAERELSVSDLALAIDASIPNTSYHLRLMKDKGVLYSRQEGQTVWYRIVSDDFMRHLLKRVCEGVVPPTSKQ
jgi:DNA-binding transcriptional ArsR family regulator